MDMDQIFLNSFHMDESNIKSLLRGTEFISHTGHLISQTERLILIAMPNTQIKEPDKIRLSPI